jgi:hypothetical protein
MLGKMLLPATVVAAGLLAGCTENIQYRWGTEVCDLTTGANCEGAMIQRTGDAILSFVEFDDQGWMFSRMQPDLLFSELQAEWQRQQSGQSDHDGFLIYGYAHGWRHNATECDNNVVCFRRMLSYFTNLEEVLAEEKGGKPRMVVGVYMGWRGLSTDGANIWEIASFWDRKNTAERVGSGALTELLVRLDRFRDHYNNTVADPSSHNLSRLVLTGHSFGGQVMYRALSQFLIAGAVPGPGTTETQEATGIGDLVIIVNPAFEASQYEPLHDIATSRCYSYEQSPVLLTVTSEADSATRLAFPAGRFFSTRLETYRPHGHQAEADLTAVGHMPKYRTGWLMTGEDYPEATDDVECGCPYINGLEELTLADVQQFRADVRASRRRLAYALNEKAEDRKWFSQAAYEQDYGRAQLIPNPDYSPNFPYQMLYSNGKLIPGHNEVYGPAFMDFIRKYYLLHTERAEKEVIRGFCKRVGAIEESSCKRADGGICFNQFTPLPTPWEK